MRRSLHNLSIPLPSCSFRQPIIQIRCRDPWIVFAEKGRCTKVVKKKWKIERNNKEQVQFTTLWKAPWKQYKEKRKHEGGISHEE